MRLFFGPRSFLSQSHGGTKVGDAEPWPGCQPAWRAVGCQPKGWLTLRGSDLAFFKTVAGALAELPLGGIGRSADAPATCFVSLWLRVRKMDRGRSWPSAIASWDKPRHLVARVSDVAALRLGWNALSLTRCGEPRPNASAFRNRNILTQSHGGTKVGDAEPWPGCQPAWRAVGCQPKGWLTLRGSDLTFLQDRCWSVGRAPAWRDRALGQCSSNMLRGFVAPCEKIPIQIGGGTRLRPVTRTGLPPGHPPTEQA
jgi:hypothetical protein